MADSGVLPVGHCCNVIWVIIVDHTNTQNSLYSNGIHSMPEQCPMAFQVVCYSYTLPSKDVLILATVEQTYSQDSTPVIDGSYLILKVV